MSYCILKTVVPSISKSICVGFVLNSLNRYGCFKIGFLSFAKQASLKYSDFVPLTHSAFLRYQPCQTFLNGFHRLTHKLVTLGFAFLLSTRKCSTFHGSTWIKKKHPVLLYMYWLKTVVLTYIVKSVVVVVVVVAVVI